MPATNRVLTTAEQRAAVEAHPSMILSRLSDEREDDYDLRNIALWILDHPLRAEYRLSDWWHSPLSENTPPPFEAANGTPVYFLGFAVELAAYRLIAHACRGEVYAPAELDLVIHGGAPL